MLAVYIFALVLGGGFLGLSLLGDFFESEVGDVDVDVEVDMDVDTDVDHGGAGGASKIFSLRTIVYALFGFGAVGTVLSTVGGAGAAVTAGFATVGGLLSGALINSAFNYLKRSDSGALVGEASLVGLTGKVTLPVSPGSPGKIAVEQGGRRLELRALPHDVAAEESDPAAWGSVIVVEMKGGIALVAPVDDDLRLGP